MTLAERVREHKRYSVKCRELKKQKLKLAVCKVRRIYGRYAESCKWCDHGLPHIVEEYVDGSGKTTCTEVEDRESSCKRYNRYRDKNPSPVECKPSNIKQFIEENTLWDCPYESCDPVIDGIKKRRCLRTCEKPRCIEVDLNNFEDDTDRQRDWEIERELEAKHQNHANPHLARRKVFE